MVRRSETQDVASLTAAPPTPTMFDHRVSPYDGNW